MGFDIGVTLSAQIPINIDEFVNAVLTLSPLREFEHPERGRVFGMSLDADEFWTRDDIIEGLTDQDGFNDGCLSRDEKEAYLVVGRLGRSFYKGGGAEDIRLVELDLDKYKECMVTYLQGLLEGKFTDLDSTIVQRPFLEVQRRVIDYSLISSLSSLPSPTPFPSLPSFIPCSFPYPPLPLPSLPVSPSLSRLQPPQPTIPVDLAPVEEEWPQIPKDESVETRTKARVYFDNLIREVKKITVWTMSVDMN